MCLASPSCLWLAHLSADNLLPWAYPWVDYRPYFVDTAAACRCTRGQQGHGLQLAVPLARRGRGYALPSPPRCCRLSRPSPAGPSCDVLQSLKKRTPGTSCSNSGKGKVLTAKSMTQMNSADKDPFAVNLLNLWKFIVIHRKFVK